MRVLIVGCGYVGMPLGRRLALQGHTVFGTRRCPELSPSFDQGGIRWLAADITAPETIERLPGPFDWVVNTVSAGETGAQQYRSVYLQGTQNLVNWLQSAPPRKFIYTSSTAVYGQTDGSEVDENSPTSPATETGQLLLETERLLLKAAHAGILPTVILRVAGIYGPDRGYWLKQYLSGKAVMEGDGQRLLNMIHREDVVGSLVAGLERGHSGQIYNAVDSEPVAQRDMFLWLSQFLGKGLPPASAAISRSAGKRGWTNKKVSNRKLITELGYQLRYPTYREGFAAEIQCNYPA
jgi:nucleoside-diphosphate-sugar epimerase